MDVWYTGGFSDGLVGDHQSFIVVSMKPILKDLWPILYYSSYDVKRFKNNLRSMA